MSSLVSDFELEVLAFSIRREGEREKRRAREREKEGRVRGTEIKILRIGRNCDEIFTEKKPK